MEEHQEVNHLEKDLFKAFCLFQATSHHRDVHVALWPQQTAHQIHMWVACEGVAFWALSCVLWGPRLCRGSIQKCVS